ncbi:MAG: TonB-dependent receptor [Bacteroidales bacterium]|nr:TonB-dependent receptor [Bacteroidales bacterium]
MRNYYLWRKRKILLSLNVAVIMLLFLTNNISAAGFGDDKSGSPADMQGIAVRGVVRDASTGALMPGVNVRVNETTIGTITDAEGRYSFATVDRNATLTFSFIGYVTQIIPLNGRTTLDVNMPAELLGLNEVVVVGYGSAMKRNVASATSALKSDEIVGLATTDPRQVLQGKIAGVQVTNNSGDPGSGARIVIRGMGSFSNTDPLYVIDGIQGGDINSIAPQDIDNITILKDASTTAIYGSAAANGVVLITTKSGKKGDLKVEYEGSAGFANVTRRLDLLNASEYVDMVTDIQHSNGLEITAKLQTPDVRIDRTDWQDVTFQRALMMDHNLRFGGGTENVTYSFSAGYQNQGSTVIDRNFQRITFGAKMTEALFKKRVNLSQNLRVKNDINNGVIASLNEALRMAPYLPIYDPTNLGGYARMDKVTDLQDANNPYNTTGNTDYNDRGLSIDLDLSGEIELLRGLTFRSQGRISGGNYHNMTFNYPCNGGNFNRATSDINEYFNFSYGFILENYFSFSRNFGSHHISAMLGNTYDPAGVYRSISVAGSDYTSDAIQNLALANSTSVTGSSVNSGKSRLSYFGRIGYTYKEKYVINASLRRDASSVFGINNRWGTFYGVGLAWTVSREDFMSNFSSLSNLKLRTSYGKTGNDNIPAFLTSSRVWKGTGNNIVYSFGDDLTFATGSIVNSVPNPDLKWEETTQFDFGFDLGLLKDRIGFTFDYYNRSNKDLLIETLLPLTTGLGNPGSVGTQWINAASMKNSGFEASLTYKSNTSIFRWDLSLNATYSVNEVTALGTVGDLPISKGEFMTGVGNATRTDIGHPLGAYYGYVYDHVVRDPADLNALNAAASAATGGEVTEYQVNAKPGDRVWKDMDGNGYINADDRTFIGNPSPKWQYGVVFNAFFKSFDLQLLMHGVAGVDAVNGSLYWWEGMSKPFNQTATVLTRWKEPGDVTDIPRAGQNSGANLNFSTWYVEKGDYLRVKNISIGYNLPQNLFNVFEKFRIYASIQNALTLTKYSGYDPEISSTSPNDNNNYIFQRGIDMYQRPNPRIMRLGVQLTF